MIIETNSFLQTNGNYYLNADDFDSRLLLSDSLISSYFYAVVRFDSDDYVWKVIANGKLNGYTDSYANNLFKFDFSNYIKISHYRDLPSTITTGTVRFVNNATSKVALILNPLLPFTSYTSLITTQPNGEVWLNGEPSTFTSPNIVYNYTFVDGINYKTMRCSSPILYGNSWFPFTLTKGITYSITTYNGQTPIYTDAGSACCDNRVIVCYIPAYATSLHITINYFNIIYPVVKSNCSNQLFYYGIDGQFDMMYLEGNVHKVDNITKKYIQVGDKELPLSIKTQKQLKCNTGFKLKQEQVYSLIKTPYTFFVENKPAENSTIRNLMEDGSFEFDRLEWQSFGAYNEIGRFPDMFAIPSPSSDTILRMAFAPANSILTDSYMYITPIAAYGVAVKPNTTYTFSYDIICFGTQSQGSSSYVKLSDINNNNVRHLTLDQPWIGSWVRRTLTFTTDSDEVYFSPRFGIVSNEVAYIGLDNMSLVEGSVSQLYVTPLDNISFDSKVYKLDTSSFEGYIGNKLSEKNIELLLTNEKEQVRKTSPNITFWD